MSKIKGSAVLDEAIKGAFGDHAEDVVAVAGSASDVCDWLGALFECIAESAGDPRKSGRVKALADLGKYMASDSSNYFDSRREEMTVELVRAGVMKEEGRAQQ